MGEIIMRRINFVIAVSLLNLSCIATITVNSASAQNMTSTEAMSRLPSVEILTAHIQQDPSEPRWYFARGLKYMHEKQWTESIADWSKLISMNYKPDGSADKGQALYEYRSICYMKLRKFDAAIADLNKVISLTPNEAVAIGNRGAAFAEKKQYAEAMKDYTKALQLDPRQPAFYEGIGEVSCKTHQYTRAMEYLNRAIVLESTMGDAFYYRAVTLKALGKTAEANADFKRATALGFKLGEMSSYERK